jgi:hypothetical protein
MLGPSADAAVRSEAGEVHALVCLAMDDKVAVGFETSQLEVTPDTDPHRAELPERSPSGSAPRQASCGLASA